MKFNKIQLIVIYFFINTIICTRNAFEKPSNKVQKQNLLTNVEEHYCGSCTKFYSALVTNVALKSLRSTNFSSETAIVVKLQ